MGVGTSRSAEPGDVLARLDRLPRWSLPRLDLVILGLGYFFTFYDIADIGFGLPAIASQFSLSGSAQLFVALSVGLIGYIVGSFAIGALADRYGRRRMLAVTFALTALGSFGDAAATGLFTLAAWRFVTGMGVGAGLNLVSTYLGELAPAAHRGRIAVVTFLVGILGQAVTPFVALALVPSLAIGWRLLFVFGGVIGAVGLGLLVRLPESPRWLVQRGREREASEIVAAMEARSAARGDAWLPLAERRPAPVAEGLSVRRLFHRPYLDRLAIFVPMWFLWYIGNYAFLGDAATLLSDHGLGIGQSIGYLAVGALGYPVGALVMIAIVDRYERRFLLLASSLVWAGGMAAVGSLAGAAVVTAGSFLASLSLGMFLQVGYTFTAESFPTPARAIGFAGCDGFGHLGGALGALLLPVAVGSWGFGPGFLLIAGTGLAAGAIALAGPRTTARRLEDVSR